MYFPQGTFHRFIYISRAEIVPKWALKQKWKGLPAVGYGFSWLFLIILCWYLWHQREISSIIKCGSLKQLHNTLRKRRIWDLLGFRSHRGEMGVLLSELANVCWFSMFTWFLQSLSVFWCQGCDLHAFNKNTQSTGVSHCHAETFLKTEFLYIGAFPPLDFHCEIRVFYY